MNEDIFKNIMYSDELNNLKILFMLFAFVLVFTFVIYLTSNKTKKLLSGINNERKCELLLIIHNVLKKLSLSIMTIFAILLFQPGKMMLFPNMYNVILLSSFIIGFSAFLSNIISDFFTYEYTEKNTIILLGISCLFFIIGLII